MVPINAAANANALAELRYGMNILPCFVVGLRIALGATSMQQWAKIHGLKCRRKGRGRLRRGRLVACFNKIEGNWFCVGAALVAAPCATISARRTGRGAPARGTPTSSDAIVSPQPAPKQNANSNQDHVPDLERGYSPQPPRRSLGGLVILDNLAVAQKRHPIFHAEFLVEKIAVSLAVVPAIANGGATEAVSARRAVTKCDNLGDHRPEIPGADFIDERQRETPAIVFKPELMWDNAAAEYYSVEFEVGVVSQNPGDNECTEAVGDDRTIRLVTMLLRLRSSEVRPRSAVAIRARRGRAVIGVCCPVPR